jgi:hypothetical protein
MESGTIHILIIISYLLLPEPRGATVLTFRPGHGTPCPAMETQTHIGAKYRRDLHAQEFRFCPLSHST